MKNITLLFVTLMATAFTACDEEPAGKTLNQPMETAADGEWHLVQVTGSIAGINHLFEPATITWTFNDNGTVSVINTNTDASLTDFFETGTYSFGFVGNEDAPEVCNFALMIDNINFGCQVSSEEEMTLTNTWADGYQLRFIKM